MKTITRPAVWAVLAAAFLLSAACLKVRVIEGVDDPEPYFEQAQRRIARLERDDPFREGRAHRLSVLIHEDAERRLVEVTVPVWIVNLGISAGGHAAEHDRDLREWSDRYEFDWRALSDFGRFGRGLLVEIEDVRDRLLIWMH